MKSVPTFSPNPRLWTSSWTPNQQPCSTVHRHRRARPSLLLRPVTSSWSISLTYWVLRSFPSPPSQNLTMGLSQQSEKLVSLHWDLLPRPPHQHLGAESWERLPTRRDVPVIPWVWRAVWDLGLLNCTQGCDESHIAHRAEALDSSSSSSATLPSNHCHCQRFHNTKCPFFSMPRYRN